MKLPPRLTHRCIATALTLCLCIPLTASANTTSVAAWLKRCGGESPESMRTRRVQGIFNQVKKASDARGKQSKLYILQCDGWPWAATLQDRNIILTRGAIETIYGSDDAINAKDARMAFVLGHELKHVHEDDFWHETVRRQQFMSVQNTLNYGQMAQERRRHDERRADEDGFIYAALAGFDMREIFKPVRGEAHFLADWARQTGSLSGISHFSHKDRAEHLSRKLKSLDNAVEFFKFGVRLAHFGRYETARVLLEDFQNIYPSAQVYNNLGYIYLQMARREMPAEIAYRYWYPLLIDIDAGVSSSPSRNLRVLPPEAERLLRTAIDILRKGLSYHNDTTAAVNLIAAQMYLGEYTAAQATIESIRGWSEEPQLIALDALALVQNKRLKNPWNTYAQENFTAAANKPDAADNVIYNYARMLSDHGYQQQAQSQFNRLTHRLPSIPANFRNMICREVSAEACDTPLTPLKVPSHWQPAIQPGHDIDAAATRHNLQQWNPPIIDKLDGIDARIYTHPDGSSLLALNGVVEIINIRQHNYDFRDHLLLRNGQPLNVTHTIGDDSVLSYGKHWAALVRDQEVREIWLARSGD